MQGFIGEHPVDSSAARNGFSAERMAGPGRAAWLSALRLRARVRVVGGQHHAARVLHLHPQRRMSPR